MAKNSLYETSLRVIKAGVEDKAKMEKYINIYYLHGDISQEEWETLMKLLEGGE